MEYVNGDRAGREKTPNVMLSFTIPAPVKGLASWL